MRDKKLITSDREFLIGALEGHRAAGRHDWARETLNDPVARRVFATIRGSRQLRRLRDVQEWLATIDEGTAPRPSTVASTVVDGFWHAERIHRFIEFYESREGCERRKQSILCEALYQRLRAWREGSEIKDAKAAEPLGSCR